VPAEVQTAIWQGDVAGLVEARREGTSVFYHLARPEIRTVVSALHEAYCSVPQRTGT